MTETLERIPGDWLACRVGSCHRHGTCQYHPCRAARAPDDVAQIAAWLRLMAGSCQTAVAIGASAERADAFQWAADAIERGEWKDKNDD